MFIEYFCAACGSPSGDFEFMADPCKKCGCFEKRLNGSVGIKMAPETTSAEYKEWFHSEPVQAKLKSGEFEIAPKSANINQY